MELYFKVLPVKDFFFSYIDNDKGQYVLAA